MYFDSLEEKKVEDISCNGVLNLQQRDFNWMQRHRHVCTQVEFGGVPTKVADANIGSIRTAVDEESSTVDEISVLVTEEEVSLNPTVNYGETEIDNGRDQLPQRIEQANNVAMLEDYCNTNHIAATTFK